MKKMYLLFAVIATVAMGCEKKAVTPKEEIPTGNVVYTVVVSSTDGTSIGKGTSANIIANATVFITQSNGVRTQGETDESGSVVFKTMPGINAVTVKAADHTTVTYTVDLRDVVDTSTNVNIGDSRSAATIIQLYKTSGSGGTTTVTGKVRGDFNANNSGLEDAPNGTKVIFFMKPNPNSLNHQGPGSILSSVYEFPPYVATITGGLYQITIPGSSDGIGVSIVPSEILAEFIPVTGPPVIVKFSAPNIPTVAQTGRPLVEDITYVQ